MRFREIPLKDVYPGCMIMTSFDSVMWYMKIAVWLLRISTPHGSMVIGNGKVVHTTKKKDTYTMPLRTMPLFFKKLRALEPIGIKIDQDTIDRAAKEMLKCKFNQKKLYAHWVDMVLGTRFANLVKDHSCVTSSALFYRECGIDCPPHLNPVMVRRMTIKPKKSNWLKKILFKKITFGWKPA